jgi:predicted Na+-dependent transporter
MSAVRGARGLVAGYPELALVVLGAAVGLAIGSPLAWVASHQGINALLALLVLATALTIDPGALRRLTTAWRPLTATLITGITVLPALSWALSRIVAAGSLRDGVASVGLAPCEIASVATTALAGGEAAVAAGVLIGSTVLTVALAGPILSLEVAHTSVHPAHIVINLALVVALPLAAGLVARAAQPDLARIEPAATTTAMLTVAALVALIAAEIHLSSRYALVILALVLVLAGSAAAGRLIGRRSDTGVGTAILLTTSMRDFAIAAGLATAAFGAKAAAPLGLYGVLVLVWGTAVAGRMRSRGSLPPA